MGTKIYSLTQCSLTVNEYDWHILAGNDERINSHCLIRTHDPKSKHSGEIETVKAISLSRLIWAYVARCFHGSEIDRKIDNSSY